MKEFNLPFLTVLLVSFASFSQAQSFEIKESADNPTQLDSTVSYNYIGNDSVRATKTEYSYDAAGNQTLRSIYSWDAPLNQWIGEYKSESSYDENGNNTLYAQFSWNAELNHWIGERKTEYSFDSAGNQTSSINYNWDLENDDWILSEKEEDSYDDKGNIAFRLNSVWNAEINDWIASYKSERSYHENWEYKLWVDYRWNTELNDWVPYSKSEINYDDAGNKITIHYQWDSELKDWMILNKEKYENTFDEAGNITLSIIFEWDSELNDWVQGLKLEAEYDDNRNQTSRVIYLWDSELKDWLGYSREENSYSELGYIIGWEEYLWNSELKKWVGEYKWDGAYFDEEENKYIYYQHTWDNQLDLWVKKIYRESFSMNNKYVTVSYKTGSNSDELQNDTKQEIVYDEQGNEISIAQFTWFQSRKEWYLNSKEFSYYSSPTVGIEQLSNEDADIILYPNPTSGLINLTGISQPAEINIYNIKGQQVKSFQQIINRIDIAGLGSGIYILNITSNNKTIVKKVVKE